MTESNTKGVVYVVYVFNTYMYCIYTCIIHIIYIYVYNTVNIYIYIYMHISYIYIYIKYIFVHVCLSAFNAQLAPSFARQLFENSFACIRQLWASWPVPKKYSSWTSPKKWTLKVGKNVHLFIYIYVLYIYVLYIYVYIYICIYIYI